MPHMQAFIAYIENGSAGECPEAQLPAEMQKAKALWNERGEAAKEEVLALLSKHLSAVFVAENVPWLSEMLSDQADIAATEVQVYDVEFDQMPPHINAQARFLLPLSEPWGLDVEGLLEKQDEEGDYLRDGVTFQWNFGDSEGEWDGIISDDDGGGMDAEEVTEK